MVISTDKSSDFSQTALLRCGSKLVDLDNPLIMGILNFTPDSFYDGGSSFTVDEAVKKAGKMMDEGATFIDIGAVSTRPGSKTPACDEEINRLLPVLKAIIHLFPEAVVSVDTYRAEVARIALHEGAHMINDISGGQADAGMLQLMAHSEAAYVMMHMQGTPETMQKNPHYENIVEEIAHFFTAQLRHLKLSGKKNIVLDPGFGFGKNLNHNYTLLNHLHYFRAMFDFPLLAGISRKSMIYKPLEVTPAEALNGTTVANTIALLQGANILRVHDVKPAIEAVKLVKLMRQNI
ncbi:MAG: dihydropteroate synthase [Lentimicrobium sp.]|jgi:dihydropteroate synthase|nr:dihydropteroate synthase [Lentimicrobium sp.]